MGQCRPHYGFVSLTAPNTSGGTCSSAVTPLLGPDKTTTASCTPPVSCQEDLCAGKLAGLGACVVYDGVAPCPAGFSQPTPVWADAAIVCSDAKCTCSVPVAPCTVTASSYSSGSCSGQAQVLTADGQCNAVSGTYFRVNAISAANAACVTGGSPGATVQLTGQKTLCCR